MEIRNFQEIIDKVKMSPSKKRMVIAAAEEDIYDIQDIKEAADKAVELVREKKVIFL